MTDSSFSPQSHFADAAGPHSKSNDTAKPFSVRLTLAEKTQLKAWAGRRTLGRYIRDKLFGDSASPRREQRRPQRDDQMLAQMLARLGQSRLSQNMNQLAKLANSGALGVDEDLTRDLHRACSDLRDMRRVLIEALNVEPED